MAVFRVERTRDYTVMSNHHLKNKDLSLKAKGLLSQMLSLPENWDYTLAGLSAINRESKDAIRSAVNELEKAGYIRRRQTVDSRGKFSGNEYIIYEQPQPSSASPSSGFPTTGNPSTEKPSPENPTQLKIDQVNIQEENTQGSNTHSILSGTPDGKRSEMNRNEIEQYRALIEENIDAKCKALDCVLIHRGGVNVASIAARKVVKTALDANATSVVLAHNHPSGLALPSPEDRQTTLVLKRALEAVGVVLADHIIVADGDFVSMRDDGILEDPYGL